MASYCTQGYSCGTKCLAINKSAEGELSIRGSSFAEFLLTPLEFSIPRRYAQIDFHPPKAVQEAAAKGLALRRKYHRGGLSNKQAGELGIGSGVQRAVNLKRGDRIPPSTIRQMLAFFARSKTHKDRVHKDGGPGAGAIAWLLWGGDPGLTWAQKVKAQMEAVD